MTRDCNLKKLFNLLSQCGEKLLGYYAVKYLDACKKLYKVCVKKNLDPQYQSYIDNFTYYFNKLFDAGYVNETPKVNWNL